MEDTFNYTFFPKDRVDQQIAEIIQACEGLYDYEAVKKIINKTLHNSTNFSLLFDNKTPTFYLYRITTGKFKDFNNRDHKHFSYYQDKSSAPRGRANIYGHPVFYAAFDPLTAMREMQHCFVSGEVIYVSEWKVTITKNILASLFLSTSQTNKSSVLATALVNSQRDYAKKMMSKLPEPYLEMLHHACMRVGDLFTLEGDQHYNITSALAHDTLYDAKSQNINISMLLYPSVARGQEGINFALHPDFVDSSMIQINSIYKLRIRDTLGVDAKFDVLERAIIDEGLNIYWKKPAVTIKSVDYDSAVIWTVNNTSFSGTTAIKMSINKSTWLVGDYLKREVDKHLLKGLANTDMGYEEGIFSKPKEIRMEVLMESVLGCKVETDNGSSDIKYMKVPFTYEHNYL